MVPDYAGDCAEMLGFKYLEWLERAKDDVAFTARMFFMVRPSYVQGRSIVGSTSNFARRLSHLVQERQPNGKEAAFSARAQIM